MKKRRLLKSQLSNQPKLKRRRTRVKEKVRPRHKHARTLRRRDSLQFKRAKTRPPRRRDKLLPN